MCGHYKVKEELTRAIMLAQLLQNTHIPLEIMSNNYLQHFSMA